MLIRLLTAALLSGTVLTVLPASAQSESFLALNTPAAESGTEQPVDFCGESVPTDHPAIAPRWASTLVRQAALAKTLAAIKRRADVVLPVVDSILREHHIPVDFRFLPLLESAASNQAISHRGAAGFWQLMPGTARTLGLTVSGQRDDRFDLRKSTHAACRYLNELYAQFGSWMLVATAYNAGPNYIQQLTRQYPGMHPMALPYRANETKTYLYQAVVLKELFTRPQRYTAQLTPTALASLTTAPPLPDSERSTILASFRIGPATPPLARETMLGEVRQLADVAATPFLIDSTQRVPEPLVEPRPAPMAPAAPVRITQLKTRCLSEGSLQVGQLCIFQVVEALTLPNRQFAVGDLIQAHVELIHDPSGRVFLRTDRLTSAQTRQTTELSLVATELPHQPGVSVPGQLQGWRLSWEQL